MEHSDAMATSYRYLIGNNRIHFLQGKAMAGRGQVWNDKSITGRLYRHTRV